jgi:hypothetical protein
MPIERAGERLPKVWTVVTHENCPDGIASAIICKEALPEADVVFVQHGTEALANLPARGGLLFVDIAPPRARVDEFLGRRVRASGGAPLLAS